MQSDPTTDHVHRARISIVADGITRVVACAGDLDVANYQECGTALTSGVELAIVLDLSSTTFMDCAGYRAIAGCRRHVRGGQRSLSVRGAVGEPAHLLRLIEELQPKPTEIGAARYSRASPSDAHQEAQPCSTRPADEESGGVCVDDPAVGY